MAKKKSDKPAPKPDVIDVVCRRVQIGFFLEKTRNGQFESPFKPLGIEVAEVDFDKPYNIGAMAKDLCSKVKSDVEKGEI